MYGQQRRTSSSALNNARGDARSPDSVDKADFLSSTHSDLKSRIAAIDCGLLREKCCESLNDPYCKATAPSSDPMDMGRPNTKPLLYISDILATILSITCCILAILAVANNTVAWFLGYNNQLIVLGFLLSILNLCFRIVAPMVLCQLEATGSSRLQNYEAILRFRPYVCHAGWLWRMVIMLIPALPIGLSVGYKRFAGGSATVTVTRGWREYNDHFGMYAAPGLQPLGSFTGSSFMVNATSPVIQASRANLGSRGSCKSIGGPCEKYYRPKSDPPLPLFPRAFGFATLVLEEGAVAILDTPDPDWITQMQSKLVIGESLKVSSADLATVTIASDQINRHRNEGPNSTFWKRYTQAGQVQWVSAYAGASGPYLGLLSVAAVTSANQTNWLPGNDSWAFVSLVEERSLSWDNFVLDARMYTTARKLCEGTWVITQSGAQLARGSCPADLEPQFKISPYVQVPFTRSNLFTNYWDPMQLAENLMNFAGPRSESHWLETVVSATMAGMQWSRAVLLFGPGSADWSDRNFLLEDGSFVKNPSLKYSTVPAIRYARPALQTSPWLHLLLCIQPAIII